MGSSDAHLKARPNNDGGNIRSGDRITVEGWTAVGGKEETVAEACHGKSSTATTVSSQSKRTGISSNVYTSSHNLEEETDPTSSPSEILDEPDRKCTESPMDSDRAVYGSESVHSEFSESSTDSSDSKMKTKAAVNAIGEQFEELGIIREAVSFHNPENDDEARYINDKVIRANNTMEDINLHPEEHFRNQGTPYQVSARCKERPDITLDVEGDNAYKHKVHFPPGSSQQVEIGEGCSIEIQTRKTSCCVIV